MSDNWQESWDKMEETERRERDIGEYKTCETCDGKGIIEVRQGSYPNGMYFLDSECPRCKGTGVQP